MTPTKDEMNILLFTKIKHLREENELLVKALQIRDQKPLDKGVVRELNEVFGYFEFDDKQGEKTRAFVKAIENAHGIFTIEF